MPLLDTWKFEEVVTKTEGLVPRTISKYIFNHSMPSNSKRSCTIWLKYELIRDLMLVLIIRTFDQNSREKKVAVPGKCMGIFFIAQGRITLTRIIKPGPNSNLSKILCLFWIPESLKELLSKPKALLPWQHFLNCKSMESTCCHGNHSLKHVCFKSICSHSLTQTILHMKFDYDWPASSGDIHVWNWHCKDGCVDGRRSLATIK